jgi:hypothetical protein
LEAYKALCDQLRHDESLFWTRFQSYLFVISALAALLVGVLGLFSRPQPLGQQPSVPPNAIYCSAILVCAIGLVITATWALLSYRAEAMCDHWVEQLKYLERSALQGVEIFTKADEYLEAKQVKLGEQIFNFTGRGTWMRTYLAWRCLAVGFMLLWVILGIIFIFLVAGYAV